LANRVQLSSDALAAYIEATERAFGADIDYGQVVKFYEAEPMGRGRYSPPHVVGAERSVIAGNPDPAHISTSLIERSERDHADGHEAFHPADERILKEGREPSGRSVTALCALQFRARAPELARYARNGSRGEQSAMIARRAGRADFSLNEIRRRYAGETFSRRRRYRNKRD